MLDQKLAAGGLLMTLSELPGAAWKARLPQLESLWRRALPTLRPVRFARVLILPIVFAVATCFEPEILLMDEWILAGDAYFIGKAETRLDSFVERARVMVLASHNLELCGRWCTSAIWLDQGSIREFGPINQVIRRYQDFVARAQPH